MAYSGSLRRHHHNPCPYGSNKQYYIFGSDNGLAPVRRQAIIWNNDYFTDAYMCHKASMR